MNPVTGWSHIRHFTEVEEDETEAKKVFNFIANGAREGSPIYGILNKMKCADCVKTKDAIFFDFFRDYGQKGGDLGDMNYMWDE